MAESAPQQQVVEKNDGFIGKRIRFVVDVVFWILLALVISVFIEWLGIFFRWWTLPGALHSNGMLVTELGWLNQDFSGVLGAPAENSLRFSRTMYEVLFVWFERDLALSLLQTHWLAPVLAYFKASFTIIQLFFVRLSIITFSIPVFFLFGLIAFIDGLMVRELRRFGGDRESGYVWHHAAAAIKPLVVTPFVLYLASPWSLHPSWIILPFVLMLSIAIWFTSSKFKKYM